jgi:DNA-binding transcriptional MerR regulator
MIRIEELAEGATFKIGELAKLLEVEPYVLRYWETEFQQLQPEKTRSGQRIYRRDEVVMLVRIRALLYDEMYTIAGARRQLELAEAGRGPAAERAARDAALVANEQLVREVEALREALEEATAREGLLGDEVRRVLRDLEQSQEAQHTLRGELRAAQQRLSVVASEAAEQVAQRTQQDSEARWQEVSAQLNAQIARMEDELRAARTRELALAHQSQQSERQLHRAQEALEDVRQRRIAMQDSMRREVRRLVAAAS